MSATEASVFQTYLQHVAEREQQGLPPLPLDAQTTAFVVEQLENSPDADPQLEGHSLLDLLMNRVPAGVDPAAYVKAAFLADIVKGNGQGDTACAAISPLRALEILGTMLGGYNVTPMIEALKSEDEQIGDLAVANLSSTLLVYDSFNDITELASQGVQRAQQVLESWANADWFTSAPQVPQAIEAVIFKVPGEINTDDLSPAADAWSRPDIPLHAQSMFKMPRDGMGEQPLAEIAALKQRHPDKVLTFVGDVMGTGSSRKSATNSVLWHIGNDIPFIPNKKNKGIVLGGKIAPIFFDTLQDAGTLPLECDVSQLESGQVVRILPQEGRLESDSGELISSFKLKHDALLDGTRAGGRIQLIIGRQLSDKAAEHLGQSLSSAFVRPNSGGSAEHSGGYTLAQKMIGQACGVTGVLPGSYCEPRISTVGSQDTTGPMTRDEMKELACLGFSADFVLQTFCHTAAYPKPVDIDTQHTLPDFVRSRGGVALRPGDGIIHSWLNRMLLPDMVGTGGDSHTRFPIGISFPAGSGMVAFAATLGVMPLDVPESVLVRFHGEMQPGITLRDLVHAIPYAAIQSGDLTLAKEGKKNIYSGRILEIEGLPNMKIEQAFELADASAERSASGCTVRLAAEPIQEYLRSNVALIHWMIASGYGEKRTLQRRADQMEAWLANPQLLEPDADASYHKIIDIDLNAITEPLLCCPNDPDDVKTLSEVVGTQESRIDEVFIGSCMTNVGHFRASGEILRKMGQAKAKLWICPPTKMDQHQLTEEGYYSIFGAVGARTEMPGCSLCMGNQARVADNARVVSTSTRNFPNRLGKGADVYLASAELAAIASVLGRLPTVEEWRTHMSEVNTMGEQIYRYMNFNEIDSYQRARQQESGNIPVAEQTGIA